MPSMALFATNGIQRKFATIGIGCHDWHRRKIRMDDDKGMDGRRTERNAGQTKCHEKFCKTQFHPTGITHDNRNKGHQGEFRFIHQVIEMKGNHTI